jgi:hypothetical protein
LSFLVKKLDNVDSQCCNHYHLLSDFPSKFQSSTTVIHYKNVRIHNIPKVDKLKVNWGEKIRKLIHEMCHWKTYHNDTKYHMTLIHLMSCRVHVVFHSFKLSWAPKLVCKVEWNGWHRMNKYRVCAQNIETILESIMNIVEKTYMIILICVCVCVYGL